MSPEGDYSIRGPSSSRQIKGPINVPSRKDERKAPPGAQDKKKRRPKREPAPSEPAEVLEAEVLEIEGQEAPPPSSGSDDNDDAGSVDLLA